MSPGSAHGSGATPIVGSGAASRDGGVADGSSDPNSVGGGSWDGSGGPLVTLLVGETGRKGANRAGADVRQWCARWQGDGPGPLLAAPGGDADLSLSVTPDDARLIAAGELAPSVAFMQGRLKTSGDNALLLKVLAWTETPAFRHALARGATEPAPQ